MARLLILALLCASLAACATRGAGTTQDPCGLAQVQEAAPAGLAQQQQQALDAGQKAYNQPSMTDPAKWSPGTTWGGGAGAVQAENHWWEDRALAGAPNSLQCLVQPHAQDQQQQAGGVSPRVLSLQKQIVNTECRLSLALSRGDTASAEKERTHLNTLNEQMSTASVDSTKTVNNTYNFDGAYITQGTSNSSTGSGRPGKASTSGEGTDVAPARAPTAEEIAERSGAVPAASPSTGLPVGTVIRTPPGTVPVPAESPRNPAPSEPE